MTWFIIAIFAYFLNAVAITIDKFLLSKKIPNPAVYAFFIATLSLLALVLIPFGFHFYSLAQILIALIAGLIFTFALLYLFSALSQWRHTCTYPTTTRLSYRLANGGEISI